MPINVQHEAGKFVMMAGRYDNGQINVLGSYAVNDDEINDVVERLNNPSLIPVSPSTEFLHTAFDFGGLVETGRMTNKTEANSPNGEYLKEARAMTLRTTDDGGAQLVASGLYSEVSVVVYARPVASAIELGASAQCLQLDARGRKSLELLLKDRSARCLGKIEPVTTPTRSDGTPAVSPLAWRLTNSALTAKNRKNGELKFYWNSMANRIYKPNHVIGFAPTAAALITRAALEAAYDNFLHQWKGKTDKKQLSRLITLTFNGQDVVLSSPAVPNHTIAVSPLEAGVTRVTFRPRDLHNLVEKLVKQPVESFEVAVDPNGLLQVKWADNHGAFEVYVPTCTAEGQLIARCVGQMRPTDPATETPVEAIAQVAA
jgi:hypothetical protein